MSVNKAILVGRLGRDPETRYTSGGQAVCNFTLATDETFKDRAGERQKRTEWHRIVVWGKQAEIAQQYLHKGSLIFVEGRIQTRQWDDKEGQKRTTEIRGQHFQDAGQRRRRGGAPAEPERMPAGDSDTGAVSSAEATPAKFPTKTFPSRAAVRPAKASRKEFQANQRNGVATSGGSFS